VIDKHTWRGMVRHGWMEQAIGYAEMQAWFERRLPADDMLSIQS
jgi:hypothetical protein